MGCDFVLFYFIAGLFYFILFHMCGWLNNRDSQKMHDCDFDQILTTIKLRRQ